MTVYYFKVNNKFIRIEQTPRKTYPRRPLREREHQESTLKRWSMTTNPTPHQYISMKAWELQKKCGYASMPSPCGRGRYKILILLPFLIKAYDELY